MFYAPLQNISGFLILSNFWVAIAKKGISILLNEIILLVIKKFILFFIGPDLKLLSGIFGKKVNYSLFR